MWKIIVVATSGIAYKKSTEELETSAASIPHTMLVHKIMCQRRLDAILQIHIYLRREIWPTYHATLAEADKERIAMHLAVRIKLLLTAAMQQWKSH